MTSTRATVAAPPTHGRPGDGKPQLAAGRPLPQEPRSRRRLRGHGVSGSGSVGDRASSMMPWRGGTEGGAGRCCPGADGGVGGARALPRLALRSASRHGLARGPAHPPGARASPRTCGDALHAGRPDHPAGTTDGSWTCSTSTGPEPGSVDEELLLAAGELPRSEWREVRQLLFSALSWFLERRGLTVLHAALVGRDGEALLLLGASGGGKSTAAVAGLLAGWELLSDDLVVVAERGGGRRSSASRSVPRWTGPSPAPSGPCSPRCRTTPVTA